jgi:hypothetical protein
MMSGMMSGEPDQMVTCWNHSGSNAAWRAGLLEMELRSTGTDGQFSALKKNGLKFIHSNERMRITHELGSVEIDSQQTSALNKSAGNPIFKRSPVVYYSCKAVISRVFYGQ